MSRVFNPGHSRKKRQFLRQKMSEAEAMLWSRLQKKGLHGYRFRRQYGIGEYIADFYCPKAKLVIEIDGDCHSSKDAKEYDSVRGDFIAALGLHLLRFNNLEIRTNLNEVLQKIAKVLKSKTSLSMMLKQITKDNIHPEVDYGKPVGNEIW